MKLPKDIQSFLGWYLNPRGRMSRFAFNWAIFLAFLPMLALQVNMAMTFVEEASTSAAPLMEVMNSLNILGNTSPSSTEEKSVQDALKDLQDFETIFEGEKGDGFQIPWMDIVAFLTYLALLPLVQMRLRDMGKTEKRDLQFWTFLVYAGVLAGILDALNLSPFGFFAPLLSGVSFIALAWLSMAKGQRYIPPSERVIHAQTDKDIF